MSDFLTELREELLDGLERYERARWWRRPLASRGRERIGPAARRMAAVAVAAAAAIAVAVQVADRAPELEQGTTPPVSRLEGFHATGLVATDDSLWVTQYDIARLLRIDLQTGKVRAHIDVGGSPGGVIAAAEAVWVHDWERGRLLKVDARTNRVLKTLTVGSSNSDIAFAAGAVWTIDERGMLVRVDPDTAAVTQRVSLGTAAPLPTDAPGGSTLAAAGDTLWVVAGDGDITEIDARTGGILGRARGPALPPEKSRRAGADDSGLWISSPARREVVHIDARTRRLTRFPVLGDPGPLAIVDGRIWVGTLHDTGAVTRVTVLETDGRVVGTMPVSQLAVNIAPSPSEAAWVTFGDDNTVSPAAVRLTSP
jgi:glutamine cyclotransferase